MNVVDDLDVFNDLGDLDDNDDEFRRVRDVCDDASDQADANRRCKTKPTWVDHNDGSDESDGNAAGCQRSE